MIIGAISACWILSYPGTCAWTHQEFQRVEDCYLWLDETSRRLQYGQPPMPVRYGSCRVKVTA